MADEVAEVKKERQEAPKWIADSMLCLVQGKAYGVNAFGQTVCIGSAKEVVEVLAGKSNPELRTRMRMVGAA